MPPRPKDADEFDAVMARIAEELQASGRYSMADLVTSARIDMRQAGYGASPGAERTRLRLHESLLELASGLEVQPVKDDLFAAIRWIPVAGDVAREVSAKGHLGRHPPRDIAER